MLDIFNNNKGKILNIFFKNTEKEYYLREIGKILKKEPSHFQKALNSLVRDKILKDERKGNLRFFKLNTGHPLYKEIKKIVSRTLGLEAKLKALTDGLADIECAFIYGSIAKGNEYGESDIDLMLIGQVDENYLIKKVSRLESELGREINYYIWPKKELIKKIKNKDFFITKILNEPIIILKGTVAEYLSH